MEMELDNSLHPVLQVSDILQYIFRFLDLQSIARCTLVCKTWWSISSSSNAMWFDIVKHHYSQRISTDKLRKATREGVSVREVIINKLTYDKILEILVQDLTKSLTAEFDDTKKRTLERDTIVTNIPAALQALKSLEEISHNNEHVPESLTFQAALEPLLCCLCSSVTEIKTLVVNILEYLLLDESSAAIIESQGFVMFLYEELLNLDNPEHIDLAFRVASILLRLPLLPLSNHGVVCDLCGRGGYLGVSYKCLACSDWDYCALCYSIGRHSHNHIQIKMIQRDFYTYDRQIRAVTETYKTLQLNDASQTHVGFECASCGIAPLHGSRYFCLVCQNHLCQKCEAKHLRVHTLLKFRFPIAAIEQLDEQQREVVFPETTGVLPSNHEETLTYLPSIVHSVKTADGSLVLGKWRFYFLHTKLDRRSPCLEAEVTFESRVQDNQTIVSALSRQGHSSDVQFSSKGSGLPLKFEVKAKDGPEIFVCRAKADAYGLYGFFRTINSPSWILRVPDGVFRCGLANVLPQVAIPPPPGPRAAVFAAAAANDSGSDMEGDDYDD